MHGDLTDARQVHFAQAGWGLQEAESPRHDVGFDLRDQEKKLNDGRHVGLDSYDLLIEGG
jgi:hypothetical protein